MQNEETIIANPQNGQQKNEETIVNHQNGQQKNEETIVNHQNGQQNNSCVPAAGSSAAGIIGAGVAGAALAGGGAYAASQYMGNEEEVTDNTVENKINEKLEEAEEALNKAEEKIEKMEHNEQVRQQNEAQRAQHEATREHHETTREQHEAQRAQNEHVRQEEHEQQIAQNNNNNTTTPEEGNEEYFDKHDVQITELYETEVNGQEVIVASGEVDGHTAEFYSDDEGNVIAAVVDKNDNGTADDDEWVDFSKSDVTLGDVAEHIVEPVPDPDPTIGDEEFFAEHDVKITEINATEVNGEEVIVASGEVDSHAAEFYSDMEGNLVAGVVDENDNGVADDDEVIDFRESDVSIMDVAQYYDPEDDDNDEHIVEVIEVEQDVQVNDEIVDVAKVTIDETPVVLIDETQNGEVDLALADENRNGELEDNEIYNVTEEHIPMPTEADIAYVDYNEPDYSNDVDIDVYDI